MLEPTADTPWASDFPQPCIIHVVAKRSPPRLDHYLDILGEIKGIATLIEQSTDGKQICRYIRRLNALKAELMRARVPRRGETEVPTQAAPAHRADHIVAK